MSHALPSPLVKRLLKTSLAAETPHAVASASTPLPPSRRHKLWDLAEKHHCPVIGTCLSLEELVRFARRFDFTSPRNDEFGLHVETVGYARSRNEVSETVQRHLDKKYQGSINRFAKLRTEDAVAQAWKESLAAGEVAGALWAAYTHKAATRDLHQTLYGDIHMLSHQVGAGQATDARRLAHLEKENLALKQAMEKERIDHRHQAEVHQAKILQLERKLRKSQVSTQEAAELRRRLAQFESGQVIVDMGQKLIALQEANDKLMAAAQRVWDLDRTLKAAQCESTRFCKERDCALAEKEALERCLNALESTASPCSGNGSEACEHCPEMDSARCILYVGGRTAMVAQYRQLADRLGIRLIHHDGGQEEALSRLPDLIRGADAVVCPTDQISHSAYYQIKNQCKQVGKPCLFFRGAGVSGFALAMARVSRGEFSLGALDQTEKI